MKVVNQFSIPFRIPQKVLKRIVIYIYIYPSHAKYRYLQLFSWKKIRIQVQLNFIPFLVCTYSYSRFPRVFEVFWIYTASAGKVKRVKFSMRLKEAFWVWLKSVLFNTKWRRKNSFAIQCSTKTAGTILEKLPNLQIKPIQIMLVYDILFRNSSWNKILINLISIL